MIKEEDIINAGIEYTYQTIGPRVICGSNILENFDKDFNRNLAFEAGAKWILKQIKNGLDYVI